MFVKNKNLYNIEFFRFVAISGIVLFLINKSIFTVGFLFVEYFFILAGFFLVKNYENACGVRTILLKRILRLYPSYAVSNLIMMYLYHISNMDISINKVISSFTFISFSFVPNVPPFISWFVPALFWATLLLLLLLKIKITIKIKTFILFFVAFILYFYMLIKTSTLAGNSSLFLGYLLKGTIRAIAGVFLGGALFYFCSNLNLDKRLIQILEIIAVAVFFVSLFGSNNVITSVAFLLCFSIFTVVFYKKETYLSNLLNKRIFEYFGKITFSIYLSHTLLLKYLQINFPLFVSYSQYILACYFLSVITGVVFYITIERNFNRLFFKLRRTE